MKKLSIIFFLSLIISCTERVTIDLKNQSNRLVIEGEVNDEEGPYYVKISRSVDFYNPNTYVPYDATSVVISDNSGLADTLTRIGVGIYQTNKIKGTIGNTYFLDVLDSNKHYTASSKLSPCPDIDSIYTYYFFNANDKFPSITIQDPYNEANYYRYYVKVNNQPTTKMYVFWDKLINGTKWNLTARPQPPIVAGDSFQFVLLAIDSANFEYWYVLIQNQQNPNSTGGGGGNTASAPANPYSNISNNPLGYFSAHSIKRRNLKVN